jgi:hypothetical protein
MLGTQRTAALAPLEASENALGTELHALMASVSTQASGASGASGVPGIAVGMPQPAVKMVDDTMRTAVVERLGNATTHLLHAHATHLQPVVDGLAVGLARAQPG